MVQKDDDRQDVLDEIKRRTHFYEKPPEDLDPLNTDSAELAKYGIPPRPDAEKFHALAEFWDEMFLPPLKFAEPTFDLPDSPVRISLTLLATTTSGHNESSLNWSGAYITPRDGQQFTEIYGRWIVPGVVAPPGTVGAPQFRSTVWIGLDGERRYFDSTLPQIGTAQHVNQPMGAPYFLWWQWWMRDNPATFWPAVVPIAVQPGHRILAHLQVLNETQVRFFIKNETTNYPPFLMDRPAPSLAGLQAKVSGATAEWIVERPDDVATGLYNLADYTQVNFTSCYAVQATLPPGGVPGPGLERTLDGAKLISMYVIEGNPARRVTISKPEHSDDVTLDRFALNYVGP